MEKKIKCTDARAKRTLYYLEKRNAKVKKKKHAGEDSRIVYSKKGTAAPQLEGFPLLLFGVECRFQITPSIPSLRIW